LWPEEEVSEPDEDILESMLDFLLTLILSNPEKYIKTQNEKLDGFRATPKIIKASKR
jgi:hypothetical protein